MRFIILGIVLAALGYTGQHRGWCSKIRHFGQKSSFLFGKKSMFLCF